MGVNATVDNALGEGRTCIWSGGDVKRTYIPKLLRSVQDLIMYLVLHQQHMVDAAGLNAEQEQSLRDLTVALQRVREQLNPLFPQPEPRARRKPIWPPPDVNGIYERQGGRCYYCRTKIGFSRTPFEWNGEVVRRFQIEHAQPVSRGGTDAPDNLRLACEECNRHKGMLNEAEFFAALTARSTGVATNEKGNGHS